MDKILDFKVFCLENYKTVHNISGKEALAVFNQYNIFDYISSFYDVLHANGRLYIIGDIDEYITNAKTALTIE